MRHHKIADWITGAALAGVILLYILAQQPWMVK